jgi:glycosyltransferase involved in cell wall biosynthesis
MVPRRDRDLDLSGGERLRVLQVIGRLNMGGPAHVAALLGGRRLDPERFDALLVHGSLAPGEASLADLAEEEGARTHYLPELQQPVNPRRDLRALAKLARLMRSFRPHVVHTHTAKAGFIGRSAALALRPRPVIVHTYHGHVLQGYFAPARSGFYLRLERALARLSDRLVGVSRATVDELVRLGVAPPEKFSPIRLGLDLERLARPGGEASGRRLRSELGIGADDVLAVFVGRLVPIKRLELLLTALALARRSEPRLRLAIVGDGEIRPRLEQQAERIGIGGSVHFLGYRRDPVPVFAAADLAVLCSDNEGTPVSLIEAAAAGLPAVATDVGGVSEAVGSRSGLLVAPAQPRSLAAALTRMAADAELRARCGAEGRNLALSRFGAARLLSETEALYRELAARRIGAPQGGGVRPAWPRGISPTSPAPFEEGAPEPAAVSSPRYP